MNYQLVSADEAWRCIWMVIFWRLNIIPNIVWCNVMHLDGKILAVTCESTKFTKISLLQNFVLHSECSQWMLCGGIHTHTNIQISRQTDIQTDSQTNRQTDRHTDRHTYIPDKSNLYKQIHIHLWPACTCFRKATLMCGTIKVTYELSGW